MDIYMMQDDISKLVSVCQVPMQTNSEKRTKVHNMLQEKFKFVEKSDGKYVIKENIEELMLASRSK